MRPHPPVAARPAARVSRAARVSPASLALPASIALPASPPSAPPASLASPAFLTSLLPLAFLVSLVGCTWSVGVPEPTRFSILALPGDSSSWGAIPAERVDAAAPDVVFLISGDAVISLPGLEPSRYQPDLLPPLRRPPPPEAPVLGDTLVTLETRPLYLVASRIDPGDAVDDAARRLLLRIADRAPPGAIVVAVVALDDQATASTLDRLVGGYLQGWESCPGGMEQGAPGPLRVYYAPVALVRCTGARTFQGGPDRRESGPLLQLRTRN